VSSKFKDTSKKTMKTCETKVEDFCIGTPKVNKFYDGKPIEFTKSELEDFGT